MEVIATEAKNRPGQMLDHCQREPAVIEKSGRRLSVLLSAAHCDALVAAQALGPWRRRGNPGRAFHVHHKTWAEAMSTEVAHQGSWNDALRLW